jgi:PKD repeat protein
MPLNVTDVEGGLYSVKASTVNFPAGTYTASADLVIIAPEEEENEPPSAYFTYTPSDVYVGTEVYFDASASEDSDGEIVRYRWKIDGAWVGEGRTFSWKFTTPGIHQVTLEVVDDQGAEGYYSENIDVQE